MIIRSKFMKTCSPKFNWSMNHYLLLFFTCMVYAYPNLIQCSTLSLYRPARERTGMSTCRWGATLTKQTKLTLSTIQVAICEGIA